MFQVCEILVVLREGYDFEVFSWALVQIGNLLALFFDEAHYAFLDGMNTLGVNLSQRLIVSLSPKKTRQQVSKHQHTINAVYKVEVSVTVSFFV